MSCTRVHNRPRRSGKSPRSDNRIGRPGMKARTSTVRSLSVQRTQLGQQRGIPAPVGRPGRTVGVFRQIYQTASHPVALPAAIDHPCQICPCQHPLLHVFRKIYPKPTRDAARDPEVHIRVSLNSHRLGPPPQVSPGRRTDSRAFAHNPARLPDCRDASPTSTIIATGSQNLTPTAMIQIKRTNAAPPLDQRPRARNSATV